MCYTRALVSLQLECKAISSFPLCRSLPPGHPCCRGVQLYLLTLCTCVCVCVCARACVSAYMCVRMFIKLYVGLYVCVIVYHSITIIIFIIIIIYLILILSNLINAFVKRLWPRLKGLFRRMNLLAAGLMWW